MSAKEEILARIRRATLDVPPNERPADVPVERGYRTATDEPPEEVVATFAERVAEYQASVQRIEASGLVDAIAQALERRGVRRLVVPHDLPPGWLPRGVPEGAQILKDGPEGFLTDQELDESDGVLTGCSVGIAQTGTIVLDAGEGQGRRAITLLPDYHLCVVREDQVVGLVPEAISHLASAVSEGGRAITFVSGPSATSDIELERVEGVHGPRTLEVLLVGQRS